MLRLREQPALRVVVRLHRAVEVEVLVREVREDEHGEADAVETALDGCVRRRFHRARPVARVDHLTEQPLQVDRLRRVQRRRTRLVADAPLQVRQQAGRAPGRAQDLVEEIRRRGLAGSARDRRDGELAARVAEERHRRGRHRPARVGDDDLRNGELERMLHDESGGAVLDRLRCEVVPVGAAYRGYRRRAPRA